MSLKALLFGFFYIIILGLVLQLAFLFLAIGYTELLQNHPTAATIARLISYVVGTIIYFALMASAGFMTASIANKHVIFHALVISVASIGISLISSLRDDEFTWVSLLFFTAGILFTVTGALKWQHAK